MSGAGDMPFFQVRKNPYGGPPGLTARGLKPPPTPSDFYRVFPLVNQPIQFTPIKEQLPQFTAWSKRDTHPRESARSLQLTNFPCTYAEIGGSSVQVEQARGDRDNGGYHNRCALAIAAPSLLFLLRCARSVPVDALIAFPWPSGPAATRAGDRGGKNGLSLVSRTHAALVSLRSFSAWTGLSTFSPNLLLNIRIVCNRCN